MAPKSAFTPDEIEPYIDEHWSSEAGRQFDEEIAAYPFNMQGARVLDLGAGPGGYTMAAVRAGAAAVVWQDIEARFLGEARRRLPAEVVDFQLSDLMDLPYPDSSFDVVAMRGAFHWASDEQHLIVLLSRIIRPGGHLVIIGLNYRRPLAIPMPHWKAVAHLLSPIAALVLRRKLVTTLWSFESLTRRRLRSAGFDIVRWERWPSLPHFFVAIAKRRAVRPGL